MIGMDAASQKVVEELGRAAEENAFEETAAARLARLLTEAESLKREASVTKAQYRTQLEELRSENEEARRAGFVQDDTETAALERELDKSLSSREESRSRLRELQWRLSEAPSDEEVEQYRIRLRELEEESAREVWRARRLFEELNGAEARKAYLRRAIALMESAAEAIPRAGSSSPPGQKEAFIRGLQEKRTEVGSGKEMWGKG